MKVSRIARKVAIAWLSGNEQHLAISDDMDSTANIDIAEAIDQIHWAHWGTLESALGMGESLSVGGQPVTLLPDEGTNVQIGNQKYKWKDVQGHHPQNQVEKEFAQLVKQGIFEDENDRGEWIIVLGGDDFWVYSTYARAGDPISSPMSYLIEDGNGEEVATVDMTVKLQPV